MSYEITGRVLMGISGLTPLEGYVLAVLADCMNNDTGQCNPTHQTLASRTNISVRTIPRLISALVEKGYVERLTNFRVDGTQRSNSYIINVDKLPLRPVKHTYAVSVPTHAHSVPPYAVSVPPYADSVPYEPRIEPIIEQDKREVAVAPTTTKPAKVRFDPLSIELPKAVDREAWHDWVEYKRSSKKPIASQAVATKTANLLARHPPECQQAMVNYSIVGGYPGLYENQAGKLNGQDRRTEHQKRTDEIAAATWGAKANDW
jgi:hypothetical protein